MKSCDVAIIGAGPYGLSAAAHLRARGLNALIFGQPMSFWYNHMPKGMLLRSPSFASDLSDPEHKYGLEGYRLGDARSSSGPVPLDQFVSYGLWFQSHKVPDVDTRQVFRIEKNGSFLLTMQDGETLAARHVVVAAGISSFANRPQQFAGLPNELVSHSSEHRDLAHFKGRTVAVIGAGQSGIEFAALLHEAGANVEVLARAPHVRWLREKGSFLFSLVERILWGPAGVGPAGVSQLIEHPGCYRMLPRQMQEVFGKHRPTAASWLRQRVKDVPIAMGRSVVSAKRDGDRVSLDLNDGSRRTFDHVLLATGYRINISQYDFISPQLLSQVERAGGGFPILNSGFESSVPGLHFLGAPASWSFGPLLRFVAGAHFAAHAVARGIVRRRDRRQSQSLERCPEPEVAA